MDCWHREIDKAGSEDEVVTGAKDYLVLWSPHELKTLTHEDRAPKIDNGTDIVRLERRLAEGCYDMPPQSEHFEELVTYFWHAATRIRELRQTA